MSDLNNALPSLNLKDTRVWLSGSIPEPEGETPDVREILEQWTGSQLERGILGFVQEFSSLVMNYGGRLIHGCHPSFTPVLLECARNHRTDDEQSPLELCVSEHFQNFDDGEWDRWRRSAQVTITKKTGDAESDRDPSLGILRSYMASECTAFVAIGGRWWSKKPGRAGVPLEFERAKEAGVPCFILGGFGGVSRTFIDDNPDWIENLNNGLTDEQNRQLSEDTNFVLAAGKVASQIHMLEDRRGDAGTTGFAEM